jgi:hypothetical protein
LFESLLYRISILNDDFSFDFEKLKSEIHNDSEMINIEQYEGKDYRIKEIEISNLRGIPQLSEDNPIPYGITLLDEKGEINNAIILANNGVGKSSVFSGLEMIYAQEIGEKKLRTLNANILKNEDYINYLQNINNLDKPNCKISTVEGDFSIDNRVLKDKETLDLLNPQSHFISEYDVIRNGQISYYGNKENTIHNIVAESLGLSEYLNFLEVTERIPSYRRSIETKARNSIVNEFESNTKIIDDNNILVKSKEEELKELKKGNENTKNDSVSNKFNNLTKILNQSFDFNNKSHISDSIHIYLENFKSYSSLKVNMKAKAEKDFLEAGTLLIHEFDNCPYCKNSKLSLEEIKNKVEKRLAELNKINLVDKQLSDSFKSLTESLLNVFQDYNSFYNKIETDRAYLSLIPELNNILDDENTLYIKLAPLVNDEELFNVIKQFYQKNIPADNEYKKLADLLIKNHILFNDRLDSLNNEILFFLQKRKNAINHVIEKITFNDDNLTKEQTIIKLEKEIKELQEQIENINKRNDLLNIELIEANKKVNFVNQIKTELQIFNANLRLKVNQIVEINFSAFKEPIEIILNDYFKDDADFKLKIDLKETPHEIDGETFFSKIIVAEIINKNNSQITTTPNQYFNTFRYKLFSLMIGLSIALASRKKYRVNLPIVIDDLFSGSDFVSKNTFAKFIQDLIDLYHKHTPDMPLQIILFTHDNFIYKSALEGIKFLPNNKGINLENTIKSRMFSIKDKAEEVSITGFKFWNLINN